MKNCSKCNIDKEDSEFKPALKNRDGLYSYCNSCSRIIQTGYRRKRGIPPRRIKKETELNDIKICTRCKIEKPRDEFRIRVEDKKYYYINPTCMVCDSEIAAIYYKKHKDDPAFKQKNVDKTRAYAEKYCSEIRQKRQRPEFKKKHAAWNMKSYYRVKDKVAARMKEKRKTPEYKKMMMDYRKRNKEKIYEQERITKTRYFSKHRDNLTDEYIIRLFINNGVCDRDHLLKHPELIEAKRLQILIQRKITNNVNTN